MDTHLDVNRKSYVLRSIPSISLRGFFVLFSFYWIYRSFIINAHATFFLMGLFFLIWSLGSILLPVFVPLNRIYYVEDNTLIISKMLIFKQKIPLDKVSDYKIRKASYFDKKFDTYRAEITVKDEVEDYFELYGLKSESDIKEIIEPSKKKEETSEKESFEEE